MKTEKQRPCVRNIFNAKFRKARAILIASMLVCSSSSYAQVIMSPQKTEGLGEAIKQPEIQPFPIPALEQLKRGQELLDKIVNVVAHVPLTDASAVLKIFGYAEAYIEKHSHHIDVIPGNERGGFLSREDLMVTDFLHFVVVSSTNNKNDRFGEYFSGEFNIQKACVTLNALRMSFGNVDSIIIDPVIVNDPMPRPPKLNDVGYIGFSKLLTPLGWNGTITFTFWNQACAENFAFSYLSN